MTEVLVVVGLIVVILAILLPALSAVRTQGIMGNSMSNLRQVAAFMQIYSNDNRDTVVPSQFDYRSDEFINKGRVRSIIPENPYSDYNLGEAHVGTWADILWTDNGLTLGAGVLGAEESHAYRYSAPDRVVYETSSSYRDSPFRSMALNQRDVMTSDGNFGNGPTPYGTGATESGLPGYFAANDFFNARPDAPDIDGVSPPSTGRWYSMGQIRSPVRSMYVVDSFAGSVIAPEEEPYDNIVDTGTGQRTIQVDFRYSGNALMLFLDGHIDPKSPWEDLEGLQAGGTRIQALDRR